uniref:Uncharacterized protein n=1 Tax=Cyclocybe aegerita TaxID=1973307 RepID=O78940_CYCAE|nr:unknown [Cyclocybe aegerita]
MILIFVLIMLSKLLNIFRKYYLDLEIVFSVIKLGFSDALYLSLLDKPKKDFFYNTYFIIYRLIGYIILISFYMGFKTNFIYLDNLLKCIGVSSVFINLYYFIDIFTFFRINIFLIDKIDDKDLSNNMIIENLDNPIDLDLIYLIKLIYKLTIYFKVLLELIFVVFSIYFINLL